MNAALISDDLYARHGNSRAARGNFSSADAGSPLIAALPSKSSIRPTVESSPMQRRAMRPTSTPP